jgi:hypothetical protein
MNNSMDNLIRHLKMNELKATILLCELERASLQRELGSAATTNDRRAWIRKRMQCQDAQYKESQNDLKWLRAEERLRRPDREFRISAQA